MRSRYCVIFLGLIKSRDFFTAGMSGLGLEAAKVASILQKAPVILKSDMTINEAQRYAGAVAKAGGRVRIRKYGYLENEPINQKTKIKTLEDFVMCHQCGYKQLRASSCVRCGFHLGNNTAQSG